MSYVCIAGIWRVGILRIRTCARASYKHGKIFMRVARELNEVAGPHTVKTFCEGILFLSRLKFLCEREGRKGERGGSVARRGRVARPQWTGWSPYCPSGSGSAQRLCPVCVCVVRLCVRAFVRACVCACVRLCVRACKHAYVRACARALADEPNGILTHVSPCEHVVLVSCAR